ncbi:hypothetical protein LCGC14_2504480, partial [marine sediment metagenome]
MKRLSFIFSFLLILFIAQPAVAFDFNVGVAGGSDTQVQFNNSGQIAGDAGFTYDVTTNALTILGDVDVRTLASTGVTVSGDFPDFDAAESQTLNLTGLPGQYSG